jgi:hypothetical protein
MCAVKTAHMQFTSTPLIDDGKNYDILTSFPLRLAIIFVVPLNLLCLTQPAF